MGLAYLAPLLGRYAQPDLVDLMKLFTGWRFANRRIGPTVSATDKGIKPLYRGVRVRQGVKTQEVAISNYFLYWSYEQGLKV